MPPYSDAAETASVLNYHNIPICLVGPTAFLPPLEISINQLLAYQLYALCAKPGSSTSGVATLAWSPNDHVAPVDLHFLRAFLLPDPDTLYTFINSTAPDGTKSVLVNGIGFPVTITNAWEKWMRVHSLRAHWNESKRWLTQASKPLGDPRRAKHYLEALGLFEELTWGSPIRGFSSGESCSIASMTRLASQKWLSSENLAQASDLLQGELNDLGERVKLVNPWWIINLRSTHRKGSSAYPLSPTRPSHYHRTGKLLVQGNLHALAGTANINDSHWICFIVDSQTRHILIGDSMLVGGSGALQRRGDRADIIESLQWWIMRSSEAAGLSTTPYTVDLLHVNQQTDSNSCGIFAQNALNHYFIPSQHSPLAASLISYPRTELFIRIATHHLESLVSLSLANCFLTLISYSM